MYLFTKRHSNQYGDRNQEVGVAIYQFIVQWTRRQGANGAKPRRSRAGCISERRLIMTMTYVLRAPTNTNRFTSAIRSKMRDEIEMTSKIKHDEYWIRLQGIYIIIIIIVCLRVLLSANVHSAVT